MLFKSLPQFCKIEKRSRLLGLLSSVSGTFRALLITDVFFSCKVRIKILTCKHKSAFLLSLEEFLIQTRFS